MERLPAALLGGLLSPRDAARLQSCSKALRGRPCPGRLRFNAVPGLYSAPGETLELSTLVDGGGAALRFVFATTLLYEPAFVLAAFPSDTPVTLACPRRNRHKGGALPRRVRVGHGAGFGTLHSKLWLLQFDGFLRIVIHSANLKAMDWDGMTENFWVVDVPELAAATRDREDEPPLDEVLMRGVVWREAPVGEQRLPPFATALLLHVDAICEIDSTFLRQYDYSGIAPSTQLIASVPGTFRLSPALGVGHLQLRQALDRTAISGPPVDRVLVQVSNVGGLGAAWLGEILPSLLSSAVPGARVCVVYPSTETMLASPHGEEHGWYFYWTDKGGPHAAHYDRVDSADERFPGLLLHSKVIVGLCGDRVRWIYSGSHNLSQAAWGSAVYAEEGRFEVKNYELGVLQVGAPFIEGQHLPFPVPGPPGSQPGYEPWVPPGMSS